jgi:hypothetical protein
MLIEIDQKASTTDLRRITGASKGTLGRVCNISSSGIDRASTVTLQFDVKDHFRIHICRTYLTPIFCPEIAVRCAKLSTGFSAHATSGC